MANRSLIFILSLLLASCKSNQQNVGIDWAILTELPPVDQKPNIGVAGPITGLIGDNFLLVASGANFPNGAPWEGGGKAYQKEAFLYQISGDSLSLDSTFVLPHPIAYSANVSQEGILYSAGGEDIFGAIDRVYAYQLDDRKQLQIQELPNLPLPLSNASIVFIDEALYLIGGENGDTVSNRIYKLDISQPGQDWTSWLELPYALTHTVALAGTNGEIIIVGGRKRNERGRSTIYDRVFSVGTKDKSLRDLPRLPNPLAAGTGVCTSNGDYILIGGDDASTFHVAEQIILDISAETDSLKREALIREKNKILQTHPGFSKNVWRLKSGRDNEWKLISELTLHSPVTTTAIKWKDYIIIPSGEIRAGIRTANILRGYLIQ